MKNKKNKVKKDPYLVYKALTNYLITGNPRVLDYICKDKSKISSLKNRTITYFYAFPKLMWYINKYLNSLYDFSKWSDKEWFKMCHDICKMYGLTNTNQLFFSKYQTNEYADFAKSIRDYYNQSDIIPSKGDIESLYSLYTSGKLPRVYIDDIELLLKGEEKTKVTKQLKPFEMPKMMDQDIITNNRTFQDLNQNIQIFSKQVKEYIRSRKNCYNCSLRNNSPVILDTNAELIGPVDLLIIGSYPGNDEVAAGLPLIGTYASLFRSHFDKLLKSYNLKYTIVNSILCSSTDNIEKPLPIIKNCAEIVSIVKTQFPAKITILLGDKALKSVGIKGSITKLNGTIVDGYFIMVHPKSAMESNKNKQLFEQAIIELTKLIDEQLGVSKSNKILNSTEFRIPEDKIVDRLTSHMTLFDIRQHEDKVVFIMKDQDGKKIYYFEKIEIPIYIKTGIYKDCQNITNSVDYNLTITSSEKDKLTSRLYHDLKNLTDY